MSTKKIQILSDQTINQIAAGEVVENPASVVKELVENSIDANSSKITVEIKGGGHFFIRITDDGDGMSKDDAILAFERHATSKIKTADDLTQLVSMGFRGEALASIGAVSKIELETSQNEIGTKVICHGGRLIKVTQCSRQKGTTIEVSSLFYNTPARKKFQKSAAQSTAEIVRIMTRLALAHKSVAFQLISQEKTMVEAFSSKADRIEEVLGKDYAVDCKEIDFEENGHKITGIVGSPQMARQNRSGQYLFINHRPIFSPLISKNVLNCFGTRLGSKMHPIFALYLEIPPDMIDVNVHPQKSEVRFREEKMISFLLEKAIGEALFSGKGMQIEFTDKPAFSDKVMDYSPPKEPIFYPREKSVPEKSKRTFIQEIDRFDRCQVWGLLKHIAFIKLEEGHQLFDGENEQEKILLLDLFLAEGRIQADQIYARLEKEDTVLNQALLFPETLQFTKAEALLIEKHLPLLEKIGMTMRMFGEDCFILEAIAPYLSVEKCRDTLLELIEEFTVAINYEKITSILSKAHRKKNYRNEEVKPLLKSLMKTKDPYFSPNGRKIIKFYQLEEIESLFKKEQYVAH